MQRGLDLRLCIAAPPYAFELRRNDLGVVEHQHVAGSEQGWQVADCAVIKRLPRSDHEHLGAVAWLGGAKRDTLLRQFEVKEINAHQ